jgi:hypothetical protein
MSNFLKDHRAKNFEKSSLEKLGQQLDIFLSQHIIYQTSMIGP